MLASGSETTVCCEEIFSHSNSPDFRKHLKAVDDSSPSGGHVLGVLSVTGGRNTQFIPSPYSQKHTRVSL